MALDVPFSYHFNRLRRFIREFDPNVGAAPLKPLRVQPLYFPTWRVGAEALSNLGINDNDSENQEDPKSTGVIEYLHSRDLYHPGVKPLFFGHHMLPLSALSFATSDKTLVAAPWKKSMSQLADGTDVVCLPFTLSPLTFANTLKESLLQNINITENDTQPMLFSCHFGPAHPVLFPIYLVQYDVPPSGSGHKPDPLTIILEAHEEKGALFAENINDLYLHPSSVSWLIAKILTSLEYKEKFPLEFTPEGKPCSFISTYRSKSPSNVWGLIRHLSTSVQQFDRLRHTMFYSWQDCRHRVDWNDPRIQPWSLENRLWVEAFRSVKVSLIKKHFGELMKQPAIRRGDLAAVHAFLYDLVRGKDLRDIYPWYYDSLRENTIIIKK
ncbi:hypothetical protein Clacol_002907 [Clathrus columnatus]|uniref:Uncharacterized protein n=1 Tax=Clathrus columnatus TaxID=1419009 RepID=A0AAV5A5E2_9AGAM|nr:hypothetical protein Clacol_002907 [Clathrus columnatus]